VSRPELERDRWRHFGERLHGMNVPSTAPAVPDDPAEVVTVLREAAAKAPEGAVRLLPGLADEAVDSWNVPVPEDIRAILRQVGGLATPQDREDFTPDHQLNGAQHADVCGEEGTSRLGGEFAGLKGMAGTMRQNDLVCADRSGSPVFATPSRA
jgi:hypothetical protein